MSVRRMYYMACDVCLEILDHSDQDTPGRARADAKAAGWIRRRVTGQRRLDDVCRKCQNLSTPPVVCHRCEGGGLVISAHLDNGPSACPTCSTPPASTPEEGL